MIKWHYVELDRIGYILIVCYFFYQDVVMRTSKRTREELLFNSAEWHGVTESQKAKMVADIGAKSDNQILNTSTEDLARYYAKAFDIGVPDLDHENITVDQQEVQIDVSHDSMRFIRDRSQPFHVSGTAIEVEVPFEGDAEVFKVQPPTYTMNPPRGCVTRRHLTFVVSGTKLTADKVSSEIQDRLAAVEKYLDWLREGAGPFNQSLFSIAKDQIEARKAKLLADRNLVAGLGFKVRKREDAKNTYSAPNVRRKVAVRQPTPSTKPFKPEPVLEEKEYQHILGVLNNMVHVMEQSPAAFSKMDEESLRTHFLVQLNGHYEGNATGETFNFDGKTDVLIKADGKNIFIGECKFWRGEKAHGETIDQLLGYVSWRDTKTAILVFNRNKDFSGMLPKVKDSTTSHPNCKRLIEQLSETSWRYLFSQPDDSNREMIITVQVYNVPEHIEPRIRAL
ncbi:hypothetical protein [Tateyamaria sp.]|uniref:hypothetical protein n=1 Tax=Tateyamaria sp. TaxID=1929288 RepID=UPI00329FDFBF